MVTELRSEVKRTEDKRGGQVLLVMLLGDRYRRISY